jgi:phosphopantetheinyl transferase
MIDLWCAPGHAIVPHALGADEQARAERFLCARTARTYRAAHTLKRRVLSHYRPEVAPADWRFDANAWGKPVVAAPLPGPAFNLSHSGDRIAIAVSDEEIGVDVECLRPLPHADDVARHVFHARELAWLARQPRPLHAFFRLWTLKEALLKAAGTGFSHPPKLLVWEELDAPWATATFAGRTWLGATRLLEEAALLSVALPMGSDVDATRLLRPTAASMSVGTLLDPVATDFLYAATARPGSGLRPDPGVPEHHVRRQAEGQTPKPRRQAEGQTRKPWSQA